MAKSKDSSNATSEPVPPITNAAPVASSNQLYGWVWFGAAVYVIGILVKLAYRIRMGAIDEFGPVIHEFDPYFNFRATEVSASTGGWRVVGFTCPCIHAFDTSSTHRGL